MEIRRMFNRPINRDIKGVIKVGQDDDKNIKQELEEYVVTNELHQHIGQFFSSYKKGMTNQTDKIGVWISGFFGSGKSHFLKILSYLIENREVEGKEAIAYFEDKIDDPAILTDLKKAGNVTTDVVLFDIDAKSESDSMADKESIVKVLNKVFNEMQGFCGAIPWIAEIERNMQQDGVYDTFKTVFQEISGNPWEDAREDFYYEEDAIIETLTKATHMSDEAARNWFERAEQDYSISIERFASRVKEYIEEKGNNHHVFFLIDEVGQYIGDNPRSMLNLQTIVHELGRQCKGQAWIAVTSQEDIDSVLSVKGNDFSKIQGRFDTKLSLSSAFVDEVIKKRILEKNEPGRQTLEEVYRKKGSVIKSILTFSDDSAEMKQYENEADFIDVYPFVPYQFNLLQKVFTGVRIHGASGKHLAEGERSLLSAFQESAILFGNQEEGSLVPFSAFYKTIEGFLDSNIRTVIINASRNERLEEFDVEVLKLLFLIKYVKELPTNLENMATLMINHIDIDKLELKKKIEKSFQRLLKETLIQKNGKEYVFLTNDEQDVNREIKNMHVETSEVIYKIGQEIFPGIYKDKKYRYSREHHFGFNAFIDNHPIRTQPTDIGIHILTPYADFAMDYSVSELKMLSMRENSVILRLPADTSYLDEMDEILKIQAYLKLKSGVSVSQTVEDIKTRKGREVTERRERVTTAVTEALKVADIFVNGQQLEINHKQPTERINEALHMLVDMQYSKLNYVEKHFLLQELEGLLTSPQQLAADGKERSHLAKKEVDYYVSRLARRNQHMTVKGICTYFSEKPYGWLELDTTALLLQLFKEQEVKLMLDNSEIQLSDKQFLSYVTKRQYVDRVVVKKRERISPIFLKNARDLSQELFGISALPTDEDGLRQQLVKLFQREKEMIKELLMNYRMNDRYPGEHILLEGDKLIRSLLEINDTATFYKQLQDLRHELREYAELSKQVKGFFENQQDKFDEAVKRLTIFEKNRTYVTNQDILQTIDEMDNIVNQMEPYDKIQELPGLYDLFDHHFVDLLEEECKPVKQAIKDDWEIVKQELNKDENIKEALFTRFRDRFEILLDRLERVNNLYEAVAMQVESDRLKIRCMNDIEIEREKQLLENRESDVDEPIPQRKTKTLSKNMVIKGTKTFQTEADIDDFVEELRKKLLAELDENTTINFV